MRGRGAGEAPWRLLLDEAKVAVACLDASGHPRGDSWNSELVAVSILANEANEP